MRNAIAIALATAAAAGYAWLVAVPGIGAAKRECDQKMAAIAEERRAMEARHQVERQALEKWQVQVKRLRKTTRDPGRIPEVLDAMALRTSSSSEITPRARRR
jgi:hypothetical protein